MLTLPEAQTLPTLGEARARLEVMRRNYDQGVGARRVVEERLAAARERRAELERLLVQWDLERLLLGKVSDLARSRVKAHVEATVTAALQAVLGRPMRFEVRLRDLGGQPAADWLVVSEDAEGEIVTDPEDGRGGGVLDIVSLALRMAVLELTRPRIDGPLIIDEGGKHVSRQYLPALAEFLKEYAARTGRQVLFVTHAPELAAAAHKAYRFRLEDGVTEVGAA